MSDEQVIVVTAGTVPVVGLGEVTDRCAVGEGPKLYATQAWLDSRDADRASWAGRSWWRRTFNVAPKGYWKTHDRGPSPMEMLTSQVMSIFGY
jgi:hypothetical protein